MFDTEMVDTQFDGFLQFILDDLKEIKLQKEREKSCSSYRPLSEVVVSNRLDVFLR